MAAAKVLHVAFDACDAGLMQRLAAAGRCPNLARLLTDGAVVDTIAPYGTFIGSSWLTITMGTEVGTHRYYNWSEIDPATYAIRPTTPREARGIPFWQRLSDAGKRVAVLDVPHADLPTELDGVLLKEWGCHDRHHGVGSHPPELLAELDREFGRHPYGCMDHPDGHDAFAPCDYTLRAGQHRTLVEERQLYDVMLRGIVAKRAVSLSILDRGSWDLFLTVLGEGHCVGHQFWHVHDEQHPRHDPSARALLGDPVEEVYARLDAVLGDHLERADDDTTVFVQMNHGMGPHYDGDHLLDELLLRIDRTAEQTHGWRTNVASRALAPLPVALRRLANRVIAAAVRHRARNAPPALSTPTGPSPDRRFNQLPGNTTVGGVRFNVVGREARGIVHPGPELDALQREVAEELLAVVDVATGRPAVRAVVPSEEVLERSPGDGFPDLFVEWERSSLMEQVWSPRVGTVAARYDHWRTGDHNDRGLFIARGPGIAPGRRTEPMALTDVAPTIAAVLGVDLPDVEGRPRADIVGATASTASAHRRRRPLRALGTTSPMPAPGRSAPARSDTRLADGALRLAEEALRRAEATEFTTTHHATRLEELAHGIQRNDQANAELVGEQGSLAARLDEATRRLAALDRERLVWTTMAWLAVEEVPEDALITVITPTFERPELLERAIRSVRAQRYTRWEMLVVDDGGESAKSVVASVGDERIRAFTAPHGGPAAARNAALDVATGEVVTYLDDDNTLDPGWLRAVAWAFRAHPEHDVLYGARVIDDDERVHGRDERGWPWLQFNPFDRATLEHANLADMGVLAHRAGLPTARFDESLWECADWDFFLALTEERAPLELPAVAVHYCTGGDDRLTGRFVDDEQRVRAKWAARRGR